MPTLIHLVTRYVRHGSTMEMDGCLILPFDLQQFSLITLVVEVSLSVVLST
ncbi:MAG: hypothetical protein AAF402_04800 [Pseudomonadota bacterium]